MRVLGNLLNQDILVAAVRAGGWAISLASIDEVTGEYMSIEIVGVAGDDQALVEWFAEQLSLPAPTLPVADAVTLESLQATLERQRELILRAIPAAVSTGHAGASAEFSATEASDELVRYMVDRFLGWRLPENFKPDAGISFQPPINVPERPSGTNLFDAQQAEDMIRHMLGGLSDDLPGPTPQPRADEAPAAAIVPPPVSAGEDVGALAAELTTAMRILGDVCAAMKPFADLGRACRDRDDVEIVCFKQIPDTDKYADVDVGHLRALLRAAGLFTDDMRPSQPPPAADASVKPAEVAATPPPAEADEDAGCPFGDPDCEGGDGDCHDGCAREDQL